MRIDIDYDDRWFLPVDHLGAEPDDPGRIEWARGAVSRLNVVEDWAADDAREELALVVTDQSTFFTTDAVMGFLYCPRGLPATAVVEIAVADAQGSGRLAALDRIPDDETALPRQITDVGSQHLGEGVLVHGVAVAGDELFIGISTYSFAIHSHHIMITVTSPDLDVFTIGRPHFDELVDSIVLAD